MIKVSFSTPTYLLGSDLDLVLNLVTRQRSWVCWDWPLWLWGSSASGYV